MPKHAQLAAFDSVLLCNRSVSCLWPPFALSIGISGVPPLVDGGSITVPSFGAFSTGAMAGADWEAHNRQGDDALEWENEQIGTFPGPRPASPVVYTRAGVCISV